MPLILPKPFWQTKDQQTVRLFHGDVIQVLRRLPKESVQMVVTSPPYWGLRDYGTAEWEGGDNPSCDHIHENRGDIQYLDRNGKPGSNNTHWQGAKSHSTVKLGEACKKCGATRLDSQIGSEATPDCQAWARGENCGQCHVCKMVLVMREVRRVLRDDGTLWLNYGDSYSSGGSTRKAGGGVFKSGDGGKERWKEGHQYEIPVEGSRQNQDHRLAVVHKEGFKSPFRGTKNDGLPYLEQGKMTGGSSGLPAGNLVGVPWRVALAMQADGWILRQDIIWHKPSPMPESVKNRCTKAHEYLFLFAKKSGYYYDAEAVREPLKVSGDDYQKMLESKSKSKHQRKGNSQQAGAGRKDDGPNAYFEDFTDRLYVPSGANKRSVWTIASVGYSGAHFATYPPKLIEPCILAGTSEYGACSECGTPWRRVVESKQLKRERPNDYVKRTPKEANRMTVGFNTCGNTEAGVETKTVGWEPGCECNGKFVKRKVVKPRDSGKFTGSAKGSNSDRNDDSRGYLNRDESETETTIIEYVSDLPLDQHPVRPCIVFDPFIGSGTTCEVSIEHGRSSWGIDLSEVYLTKNCIPRVVGALVARVGGSSLLPKTGGELPSGGRDVELAT